MTFWVTLLNVSTGVADIFLRLSPVPDIYNVHRNKSIGEVAELPLITMVVNCHLWMTYGYATDSMFPLFGSQLFGEIVGIIYNVVYFRWSSEEKRQRLRKLYAIAFAVWGVVTLYVVLGVSGVFGQTKSEVGTSLGYVGCAFSLSMFSSPLATLKHVVSTKSSASIPINMCVMILVSTALWTGAGIVDSDYFVAVINMVGVLLSCVQIVIYFMYRADKSEDAMVQLEAGKDASFVAVSPKAGAHSTVLTESPAYYKSMPSPLEATFRNAVVHSCNRCFGPSYQVGWSLHVEGKTASTRSMRSALDRDLILHSLKAQHDGRLDHASHCDDRNFGGIPKAQPCADILTIHRRKSVGEVAELPLITLVVNCHVWTLYAYASNSMFPLFATQLFGEIVGLVFSIVYFCWSPRLKRKQLLKQYSVAFAVWCLASLFTVLALAGVFVQTRAEAGTMLGYVGVAFSLAVFSSPLGTLKHVVKTKNAASIPTFFNMCVMILVTTALWVGTGILGHDYFVAGVNNAGVVLSCIQIVVYYIYRPRRREKVMSIQHHELEKDTISVVVLTPKEEKYALVESPAGKAIPLPMIT